MDVPVFESIVPSAAMLTLAALIAVFYLRVGIFAVLAGSAAIGIALYGLGIVSA
jgi:chromate transporter